MKPLHLNLAARPFRDYRPLYAVVVVMSLLIAFLMLNNIDTYFRYVNESQAPLARIADIDRQSEQERTRTAAADAQLRGVDVTALAAETAFVNARLAERAFSWSELLDRLERVMPEDVRISTIAPSFNTNGWVHLEIACDSKTPEGMINTLNELTSDPQFSNPFPHNEAQTATGYSFSLAVDFKPTFTRVVQP